MSTAAPPPGVIQPRDPDLAEVAASLEELLVARQHLVGALLRARSVPRADAAVVGALRIPVVILQAELDALTGRQRQLLARLAVLHPPASQPA
jgi:hypothetical protein